MFQNEKSNQPITFLLWYNQYMKTKIAILTGVLIIAAVIVLVVVNNKPEDGQSQLVEPSLLAPTTLCYHYNQVATTDAPYVVEEYLILETNGNKVMGSKQGTQNGPDMSNGYYGTLTGTLNGSDIDVIFDYEIEGSKNKEQELYIKTNTGLQKKRYPLIEKGKMLVPDTTKEYKTLEYKITSCSLAD